MVAVQIHLDFKPCQKAEDSCQCLHRVLLQNWVEKVHKRHELRNLNILEVRVTRFFKVYSFRKDFRFEGIDLNKWMVIIGRGGRWIKWSSEIFFLLGI